jgi:hypothetical protein
MLEANSFAIEGFVRSRKSKPVRDLRDANTTELIGVTQELSGFFTRSLRWLVGTHWLPSVVEVREKPDDSLVFTLRKDWPLFHSRLEVRDAIEAPVGHLKYSVATTGPRLVIHDKDRKDFAVLALTPHSSQKPLSFLDGSKTLATISRPVGDDNLLLLVDPELTDQPLAKMLLLAATLSIAERMLTGATG